jgi:hypothetical protein
VYDRFRTQLDQLQRSAVSLDAWECAVLDRVLIALRRARDSADADLARAWCEMAGAYLDFFVRERVKTIRAMSFLAASVRPVSDFIDELERCGAPG